MLGQSNDFASLAYKDTISQIMCDLELTEPEAKSYFNMSEYYINLFKKKYFNFINGDHDKRNRNF